MARVVRVAYLSCLALLASLVFLVPFDAYRNIDMQGLILLVAGVLAAVYLWLDKVKAGLGLEKYLIGLFLGCGIVSLLISPHKDYGLLGAPYVRIGLPALFACLFCGLLLRRSPPKTLMAYLYIGITALGLVSLPYAALRYHSFERLGGVFAQADILAVFLGCGLLLGWGLLSLYPKQRPKILATQIGLAILLIGTQTRAVLLLVLLLSLVWAGRHLSYRWLVGGLLAGILVLGGVYQFLPQRLTNQQYADESINYRLSLQHYGLKATERRPWFGYGPGNLADALACSTLHTNDLQKTCHEGYFFNSSHNIFLDRVLMVGWVGGLAFLGLVILAIIKSFKATSEEYWFFYPLVLIAGYYLTNVTSVSLELLLWILLFRNYGSLETTSRA